MRKFAVLLIAVVSAAASADDFPTTETVRMVVTCMAENGGNSEENLYTCACRRDILASKMNFREYEQAELFERYRNMPGKRGALFRDSKSGDVLMDKLKEVRKEAAAQCPLVKHISRKVSPDR